MHKCGFCRLVRASTATYNEGIEVITLLCMDCGYGHEIDSAGLIKGAKKTLYYICEDCADRMREVEDLPDDIPED